MRLKIVIGTRNFKIENFDNKTLELFSNCNISNNLTLLKEEIIDNLFFRRFGEIGCNVLFEKLFIYHFIEVDEQFPLVEMYKISDKLMGEMQLFLAFSWFIKDNSANLDIGYLHFPEKGISHRRYRDSFFSTSRGLYIEEEFTEDEIIRIIQIIHKYGELITSIVDEKIVDKFVQHHSETGFKAGDCNGVIFKSQNRIERAILFLQLARSKSYLPLKIMFYMSIYESLFTTDDSSEISHKVTERAVLYIGGDMGEKKENFKLIKKAYGIRSKFVHGQTITSKKEDTQENLTETSNKIDNLTRIILNKVILEDSEIFLKNDNDLNAWFTDLLLK